MCAEKETKAVEDEKKSDAAANGPEKKQEKRGIFGEGYGDFGGHYGGGHYGGGHYGGGHGWEEDHHHLHHHHEKTIVNVKKVPVPYPVEKHVSILILNILTKLMNLMI